ncbi:MAG: S9 family peptidase [Chitinophagaceae bacterium]|nr:S9 family peptidase [Chitinophagaceae bacterium]
MRSLLLFYFLFSAVFLFAQDDQGYKTPPKDILDLVLAKPTPFVNVDNKGEWMLLLERSPLPSVEELAQPELRIAGIRINPNNFGPSRSVYSVEFKLKNIKNGEVYEVKGLPEKIRGSAVQWNPSQNKIAFTNATNKDISLWVIDVATQAATQIVAEPLNAVMGSAYAWVGDNEIIYKAVTKTLDQQPGKPLAPTGPVIQESKGKAAASRTYQDLIKSGYDEALFEFYSTAQLKKISVVDQKMVAVGQPGIYGTWSISPDKQYLLVRAINKPFSYLFPWFGFPHTIQVLDANTGARVKVLAQNPSNEGQPIGFDDVVNFPRQFDWRDDEPATISYVQALDKGLGKSKSEYRDAFMTTTVTGEAKELFKTKRRYNGITWGNKDLALVYEGSFAERKSRINKLNPSTGSIDSLYERSSNDNYADIGTPVTKQNEFGREVLLVQKNGELLLDANGAGPKGNLPLLQSWNLKTGQRKLLWQSEEGYYEYVVNVIDAEKMLFVTRRESPVQTPNYYLRELRKKKPVFIAITDFKNPYAQLEGIAKQKISYKRADGIDLTADLYLPKGYDAKKDGLLPVLIWAYPREYKSAADAAQVRGSKYTFTTISGGSPLFWVTQGYAVMDNAEMPIVGTDGKEPNDNFIPQLYLNAHAAIQAIAKMGIGDSNRVAVGGHSYGAFMTANLLAHTKLFKAGIARSGAYNRTLTPFGFQAEERTYWQSPEVYYNMSPFSYADKIKTPLLLIHGEMDNNPGTFPIQTERLYNAIQGHGGTVRYVQLPYESHGYTSKENILHMLWEQNQWLDKYVKNADKNKPGTGASEKKSF